MYKFPIKRIDFTVYYAGWKIQYRDWKMWRPRKAPPIVGHASREEPCFVEAIDIVLDCGASFGHCIELVPVATSIRQSFESAVIVLQQGPWCIKLDKVSCVEDQDFVGIHNCLKSMGNGYDRLVLEFRSD